MNNLSEEDQREIFLDILAEYYLDSIIADAEDGNIKAQKLLLKLQNMFIDELLLS